MGAVQADVSLPNRRHKLSVAYIPLTVASIFSSFQMEEYDSSEIAHDETIRDTVSVDTILAASHRLLIRGWAGSGKTTLLQWIAVKAARKAFEGQLFHLNGCIPFYIRLRHYAHTRLPRPEAFPDFAASNIVGTMPEQWVHHLLQSGHAIVLVDGVDEVASAQREEVHTWLRDLVETYPDVYFIVTSRPHAIEEGWMNHEAFNDAMLQEMELSDIFTLIDHWHQAVEQELSATKEKQELKPLSDHLKQQVKQVRTLRNLATNPLLCAMLCALNRERRQHLPVNRIELYKACCSLLLDRREKESHIDLSDYPALNEGQKHRLLEDLGYWMIKENLSEANTSIVDKRFKQKLSNMPNIAQEISGKSVRKLLLERTNMIREPIADHIDFTHRTFQEFFAAQAILDVSETNQLILNAHNDQWREVILLAAGLASQMQCEQLLIGLVQRGDEEQELSTQLHLLAIACLDTAIELGPQVRKEIEQRLSQLIPPKSLTDAKALAAAGELALKHLQRKQEYTALTRSLCIRTITLIGGDAALELLKEYAVNMVDVDAKELLKAWDEFDNETYVRQVLSKMDTRQEFIYLPFLPRAFQLESLVSSTNKPSLWLASLRNKDLTALANLTALTSLKITNCPLINDLSALAGLTSLTTLDLSYCFSISDLSALAGLTSLTKLKLSNYRSISDLSALAGLTSLTTLDLSDCFSISDLSALTGLTSLTTLNLRECSSISDLSALAGLTSLTTLDLSDCELIKDLSPLAGLISLSVLNLRGCYSIKDVSPLAGLTSLSELDLMYCYLIEDLSPLANLSIVVYLYMSALKKKVKDQLPNLKKLKIVHP